MSDHKDQAPNSPASQSTDIPIKNTETMPSYSSDDDILFSSMDKNQKLSQLQRKAYFYVLHAFKAESPAISSQGIMIVKELMKELRIDLNTHQNYENIIQADPMVQQLRNVSLASDEMEMQKLTAAEERKITGVAGQPLRIRIKPNKDDMAKIKQLKLDAYHSVYWAYVSNDDTTRLETRANILLDLKNEWGISDKEHSSCEDEIQIMLSAQTESMVHKLDELQKLAYYNVLHAFSAESPAIASPRSLILGDLREEWNIDLITHTAYENKIKADPVVQHLRNVSLASDEMEMQKLTAAEERKITGVDGQPLRIRIKPNKDDMAKIRDMVLAPAKIKDGKVIAPEKIQDEEAKRSSTSDDSPVLSWGQVSPGSLVGRQVNIQMPDEDEYIEFLITEYDAKTETHHLVSAFSNKDYEDPCNWIDLRHVPAEDMKWTKGDPGLPVWKRLLKPGETLLHETSTTRNKKQLKEVGKTSTGIPIIRKVDKGKAVVDA